MEDSEIKEYVRERYGDMAKGNTKCCPSCDCTPSTKDEALRVGYTNEDIAKIPEEAIMGLGCGNPVAIADVKSGETVLDLGSGAGIDVFLAAQKVGKKGKVIGVDMTEEMVIRAKKIAFENGYDNIEFRLGEIENLPIEDNSIDLIISNCVINLSPDKGKVFREVYRVLKPKGRMLVSDLVTEGELPDEVKKSFEAWAGCIAGALEKGHYLKTIEDSGLTDVKIIKETKYSIDVSQELEGKITSIQVEAYKL
jgi:SAM-dependent methyltransferase